MTASDTPDAAAPAADPEALVAELEATRRMSAQQRNRFEDRLEELESLRTELAATQRERNRARAELDRLRKRRVVRAALRLGRLVHPPARQPAANTATPAASTAGAAVPAPPRDVAPGGSGSGRQPVLRSIQELLDGLPAAPDATTARVLVAIDEAHAGRWTLEHRLRLRLAGRAHVDVRSVGPDVDLVGALRESDASHLLVVPTDVRPLEDAWLDRLIAGLERTGAGAAGPRLVAPFGSDGRLTLAARGLTVALDRGVPWAVAIGRGDDPASSGAVGDADVAAVPGEVMLLDRSTVEALGRLVPADLREPLELGARVRALGRGVAYVGDSLVEVAADGPAEPVDADAPAPAHPAAFRFALLDALAPPHGWLGRPARVVVVDTAPAPPGDATALVEGLGGRGLAARAVRIAADADTMDPAIADADIAILVSPRAGRRRLPQHLVTVAVVTGDVDAWFADPGFDDIDVVIATGPEAAERIARDSVHLPIEAAGGAADAAVVVDAIKVWAKRPRLSLNIGPLTWVAAARWGDTAFARGLQRAFARQGWSASVHTFDERGGPVAGRADIALHVWGARAPRPRAGQASLLWVISHPDRITRRIADRYPVVFAGSDLFAAQLTERTTARVLSLHQATDPDRFRPDPAGPGHELLFVGSSRGVRRRILADLAGTTREVAVYGGGWTDELLAPHRLAGEWIPNDELRRWYSSAGIVLCDHYDDMRDEGFISNRAYDALASGAFVVSDRVPGIEAEFGGGLATYGDRAELHALVERYLDDPEGRQREAAIGRATVLARHTFAHRAGSILDEVAKLPGAPGAGDRA